MPTEIDAVVPTAVGDLGALIRIPDADTPLPGVVLVDGSGEGDRYDWGGWPEWIGDAGSVVLRHDKPGCGGSPGHWTEQTLQDRARESLAAVEMLRRHPAVAGQPVGLYGISQGGWVSLIAAAMQEPSVDFVVCHSGPGVSPAEQERVRIGRELRASGLSGDDVAEAMAWVDERAARILRGDSPESISADQERFAARPWYSIATTGAYDDPDVLRFASRIFAFDPLTVLPKVTCPVLTLLGGADTLIPVPASVAAFAEHLPPSPDGHGLAVFPGADHGLYMADPDPAMPRRDQLAPGYLQMVEGFLSARKSVDRKPTSSGLLAR
ncbi:alpha/beta hydrolase [Phytoactinopolyspora alkaliphila]|uniref:Alpha/beta hydrolase n=1 Tax=Phytoactinopolyspora alkaliphila TaxID=1783498 RepID=A0A6N9YTX3_9ACTN|nr:alpha/beta hydrolase [Phytoactinopolyspora alkaliphila]NED98258.1 alpha/beta hydrolase [Phytoactinopolyspora alkaliphila]